MPLSSSGQLFVRCEMTPSLCRFFFFIVVDLNFISTPNKFTLILFHFNWKQNSTYSHRTQMLHSNQVWKCKLVDRNRNNRSKTSTDIELWLMIFLPIKTMSINQMILSASIWLHCIKRQKVKYWSSIRKEYIVSVWNKHALCEKPRWMSTLPIFVMLSNDEKPLLSQRKNRFDMTV